ncbi:unnamed protein product [Agarophyton chilense]
MMAAFIARPFPIAERSYCRRSVPRSSRRPRRPRRPRPPRCVATKLLVVDLQELLRHAPPHELNQFSERVQVERNSSESGTYLLYSSRSGYAPSVKSIHDARLVEPDALAVLDGTELYQRSYRTPDPLWASNVRKDWAPKPIQWIVATFFGDHLELVETTEEYQLLFRCKPGVALSDLCSQLTGKLREMGIASRVNLYDGDRHITVTPAVSGASELVAFCQTMLGIEQKNTFVFGNDHLVETCVRGKANFELYLMEFYTTLCSSLTERTCEQPKCPHLEIPEHIF